MIMNVFLVKLKDIICGHVYLFAFCDNCCCFLISHFSYFHFCVLKSIVIFLHEHIVVAGGWKMVIVWPRSANAAWIQWTEGIEPCPWGYACN